MTKPTRPPQPTQPDLKHVKPLSLTRITEIWADCHCCKFACHSNKVHYDYRLSLAPLFLVIGEAPGRSELVLQRPFVGPSGRQLRDILAEVCDDPRIKESQPNLFSHWNSINALACSPIPADNPSGNLLTPSARQVSDCSGRVDQLLAHFRSVCPRSPLRIIVLGKTAARLVPFFGDLPHIVLPHPSTILYATDPDLAHRRIAVPLRDFMVHEFATLPAHPTHSD